MKKVHRNRLRKLADYLDTVPRKKFDMWNYCKKAGITVLPSDAKKEIGNCGTVACAAGHAAVLFPRVAKRHAYYDDFIEEDLGIVGENWDFLFSEDWGLYQPTPKQAAKRIRLFLDKGLPDEWSYTGKPSGWVWESK